MSQRWVMKVCKEFLRLTFRSWKLLLSGIYWGKSLMCNRISPGRWPPLAILTASSSDMLDIHSPYNTENPHTKNHGDGNGDDSFPSCGMSAASAAVRGKKEKRYWWRSGKKGRELELGEKVLLDGKNTQCAHRTGSSELPARVSSDPTTDLNAPD